MSRLLVRGSLRKVNVDRPTNCFLALTCVFLLLLGALVWPGQTYGQGQKPVTVISKTVSGGSAEIIITCGSEYKEPSFKICIEDSRGNNTAWMSARLGEAFCAVLTDSGIYVQPCGPAASPQEIDVRNNLLPTEGPIIAKLSLDHKPVASIPGVFPQQKAVFIIKCQK